MREPKRLLESNDLGSRGRSLLEAYPKTGLLPAELDSVVETGLSEAAGLPPTGGGAAKLWLLGTVVVAVGTWWLLQPAPLQPTEDFEPVSYQVAAPVRHQRFVPQTPKAVVLDAKAQPMLASSGRPQASSPTVRSEQSLLEELKLLDAARAQLDVSSDAALAKVRRHAVRFPDGQLADLRDYLEVKAFMRKDEPKKVRRLSRAFFKAHGESAFAQELGEALKEYGDAAD